MRPPHAGKQAKQRGFARSRCAFDDETLAPPNGPAHTREDGPVANIDCRHIVELEVALWCGQIGAFGSIALQDWRVSEPCIGFQTGFDLLDGADCLFDGCQCFARQHGSKKDQTAGHVSMDDQERAPRHGGNLNDLPDDLGKGIQAALCGAGCLIGLQACRDFLFPKRKQIGQKAHRRRGHNRADHTLAQHGQLRFGGFGLFLCCPGGGVTDQAGRHHRAHACNGQQQQGRMHKENQDQEHRYEGQVEQRDKGF